MDLTLALELLAAFTGGLLVAAAFVRLRATPTVTLYDHDGKQATVDPAYAGHWLNKGFVREWIAPPDEVTPNGSHL